MTGRKRKTSEAAAAGEYMQPDLFSLAAKENERAASGGSAAPDDNAADLPAAAGQRLDLLRFDLNKSALIEASAGTGKTYTITYLMLRLLLNAGLSGNLPHALSLDKILVVTFTNAAAADLKARIREKIRDARLYLQECSEHPEELPAGADPAMRSLAAILRQSCVASAAALAAPEGAQSAPDAPAPITLGDYVRLLTRAERDIDKAPICTIHAFCHSALNHIYAFEAGEAFETELAGELCELQQEAALQIWRECFYGRHEEELARELELLASVNIQSPEDLLPVLKSLHAVKLSRRRRGSVLNFMLKNNTKFIDRSRLTAKTLCKALREELREKLAQGAQALSQIQNGALQSLTPDEQTALNALAAGSDCELTALKGGGQAALLKDSRALVMTVQNFLQTEPELLSFEIFAKVKAEAANTASMVSRAKSTVPKMLHADDFAAFERRVRAIALQVLEAAAERRQLAVEFRTVLALLVDERFTRLKAERAQMSYDDVLLRLDQALHQGRGRGDQLSHLLRRRYEIALVDEFQDTDPLQYSIFERIYLPDNPEERAQARCYFIGDPKQSIYAFRGSDINSYLKAKRRIAQCSGEHCIYTLDTNYRSAPGVVNSVNALFGSALNPRSREPFLLSDITFSPVKSQRGKMGFILADSPELEAAAAACGRRLGAGSLLSPEETKALTAALPGCFVLAVPAPASAKDGRASKTALLPQIAKTCAAQILRCLKQGLLIRYLKDGGSMLTALRPSDIAVIVSNVKESAAVIAALAQRRIAGVYFSDHESVLGSAEAPSAEAVEILYLMEALCEPSSRDKVRRLLGCPLLSLTGQQYLETIGDERLEEEAALLAQLQPVWRQSGFLSAFMQWFKAHDGLQRQLQLAGGERRLTNYLHIAELVQQAHGAVKGVKPQLRWFKQILTFKGETFGSEETVKRLESERAQVQVRTIHNSKGLEFPVVMLPYLWSGKEIKKGREILYYDSDLEQRVLDLYAEDDSFKLALMQQDQEWMRLAYVALTRACAGNFLFIAPLQKRFGMRPHGLIRLLAAVNDSKSPDSAALPDCPDVTALQALEQRPDLFCRLSAPDDLDSPCPELYVPTMEAAAQLACSILPAGAVREDFSISSYSGLVAGLHDRALTPADDEGSEPEAEPAAPERLSPFGFPRGPAPGTLLHALLEHCDFAAADRQAMLESLVLSASRTYGSQVIAQWSSRHEADALQVLTQWLDDIICAPLLPDGQGGFLHLSDLQESAFVPEMRYLMPVERLDSSRLNALCIKSAADVPEFTGDASALYLDPRMVNGFLTGSLDLVCSFPMDGRERYFVMDYKSTYLGPDLSYYSRAAAAQSVFEQRNRYDVQYLIYTAALQRLLKLRLPDYDYDRDIGGVLYLYLRGLKAGPELSPGVFFTKPRREIVDELDRLLGGADD